MDWAALIIMLKSTRKKIRKKRFPNVHHFRLSPEHVKCILLDIVCDKYVAPRTPWGLRSGVNMYQELSKKLEKASSFIKIVKCRCFLDSLHIEKRMSSRARCPVFFLHRLKSIRWKAFIVMLYHKADSLLLRYRKIPKISPSMYKPLQI